MRLAEQLPNDIKASLVTSDNPFELAALQRRWDAINQEDSHDTDDS